ncbi:uncharacterized protein LOC127788116 [Diospyros lotus]|uniref:uncharacterized protein LOC127788116 n=1 Tax=Diospyros lotus TaxID=55363 RepID=UPI0022562477|nr:uncharacterized protein LOC127788116 [Diospyros lotus]
MLCSGKEVNVPEKAQENTGRKEEAQPLSIQRAKQHINNDQVKGENPYTNPLPFPHRATQNKKRAEAELDKEIMETFQKVEVNIPLLEAIRQIPKYAKFLKDLCTHKRKLKGNEQVNLGRNVSTLIQPTMPLKCKDPATFTIPCTIGELQFTNALLDLGASINVMPKSVYASLQVGPLKSTRVVIQLANRSMAYPTGVLEDVLVKVKDLIFPADFYVLNMEDDNKLGHAPLILGRLFLKTARTIINVHEGTLSMEFVVNTIHFNILDSMKYPSEDHSSWHVNSIDLMVDVACADLADFVSEFPTIHDFLDSVHCLDYHDGFSKCVACSEIDEFLNLSESDMSFQHAHPVENVSLAKNVMQADGSLDLNTNRLLPSIQQPLALECKPLSDNLKYAYLEEGEKLPVLIANNLCPDQEQRLLDLLRRNKRVIGWTLADILGISPSLCMHRIHLEEGARPICIASKDQEKTTFTCPFGTFAYRRIHLAYVMLQGIVLGHVISRQGIAVDSSKVDVIASLPYLASVREVRSFLGHAGFYRRFIQDFSKIVIPLSHLLQKDVDFKFDEQCKQAFKELKRRLTSPPIIQPPNWELPFELMCDVSNLAVGVVLSQRVNKKSHVIAYASRTLDSAQANYTMTEKELLAIVFALDKFRSYLLGSKVIVFSDHAALKFLLKKQDAKPRLIRWMLLL